MTLGSLTSQTGQFSSLVGNCRCNTRPMEPISTFHDSIEIKVCRISFGNSRMSTVVNHLTGTHRCTGFQIVDTYTIATTGNEIRLHTILAQSIDSRLTDFVLWQFSYEIGIMSIIGATYSNIGFTATIYNVKRIRLYKTSITWSGQSQHDFPKGYDFLSHNLYLFFNIE